jgi:TonB family protein
MSGTTWSRGRRQSLALASLFLSILIGPRTMHGQQAPAPAVQEAPALSQISSPAIDVMAANLAAEIKKRHFSRVAVFGALGPNDVRTAVGLAVGDAVSSALARQARGFRVIDRNAVRAALKQERVAETMIGSNVLALWIYKEVKADCIVMVELSDFNSPSVSVDFYLFDPPNYGAASIARGKTLLALDPTQAATLQKAVDFATRKDAKPGDASASLLPTGARAGENGVGTPICLHCPRPDYSPEASKLKIQGEVHFTVVITPEGDVTDIDVTKELGHGLDQKAVEAVRQWKVKPITDSSGKAVSVVSFIQVKFWQQ